MLERLINQPTRLCRTHALPRLVSCASRCFANRTLCRQTAVFDGPHVTPTATEVVGHGDAATTRVDAWREDTSDFSARLAAYALPALLAFSLSMALIRAAGCSLTKQGVQAALVGRLSPEMFTLLRPLLHPFVLLFGYGLPPVLLVGGAVMLWEVEPHSCWVYGPVRQRHRRQRQRQRPTPRRVRRFCRIHAAASHITPDGVCASGTPRRVSCSPLAHVSRRHAPRAPSVCPACRTVPLHPRARRVSS